MLVRDMMGREVACPAKPVRIVSLVPSQTELLADLGLDAAVAGITKFCIHPDAWFRSKTRIGGTKTVHIDRVAALRPDLILANREENVESQIRELEDIAPVWVSDIKTLEDSLEMIRQVGLLTGKSAAANTMADTIAQGFDRLSRDCASGPAPAGPGPLPMRIAYAIWRDPWMWAGGDTFISDILRRIGWQNALEDLTRYPSRALEEMAACRPDKVLLSSEPYPFKEKHLEEVRAALPGAEVMLADGEMFSWYGSRLLKAIPYLRTLTTAGA